MLRSSIFALLALVPVLLLCVVWRANAAPGLPTFTDPADAGADYQVQGEYAGELKTDEGPAKFGVQVIALGEGKFRAVVHHGGLPGDGWEKGQKRDSYDGETKDGVTTFAGTDGEGKIADGVLTVTDSGGEEVGQLKRVERKSPTLGEKPPRDAVVLFDGSNTDEFKGGTLTDDGLLLPHPEATSERSFGSFTLHLELRTPFMPTAEGQARGNSGVYLQDRYEIQVLDSFGLEGKDNECAGIYSIQAPRLNMCYPPLVWQTYDIDFTAPKFDNAGTKAANARLTMRHNGVLVYDDLELPRLTPGGAAEEAPSGPLKLQDHGNPVHYRNIWVVEKK